MAANRGEIATRIMRAGTELGCKTVGIYAHEDRLQQHRYKADQAFQVSQSTAKMTVINFFNVKVGVGKTPVGAYLDIPSIIDIAKANGVEAIHPVSRAFPIDRQCTSTKQHPGLWVFVGKHTFRKSLRGERYPIRGPQRRDALHLWG